MLIVPDGAALSAFSSGDLAGFRVNAGGVFDFELDSGPALQFNIGATQFVVDGDTITLDGLTYEYDTGAVLLINATNRAQFADGQTFTITDPTTTSRTFEIDTDGNFNTTTGRFRVNLSGVNDQSSFTDVFVAAIDAAGVGVDAQRLGTTFRISLLGDRGLNTTGVSGISQFGVTGVIGTNTTISVEETFTGTEIATATAGVVNAADMGRGALGNRVNFPRLQALNNITLNGAVTGRANTIQSRGTSGGSAAANPIDYFYSDSANEVTIAITNGINAVIPGNLATSGATTVVLSGGATIDPAGTDTPPFSITGGTARREYYRLAILDGTMYAITDMGGLFIVNNPTSSRGGLGDLHQFRHGSGESQLPRLDRRSAGRGKRTIRQYAIRHHQQGTSMPLIPLACCSPFSWMGPPRCPRA